MTKKPSGPKAPHIERGQWGEKVATDHLLAQGYALVASNWRMGHYEIDIVVQKGKYIVFVEVKTRKSRGEDPVGAVDRKKRARMVRSADAFMQRYDIPFEYRFDIVAVSGTPDDYVVEHIPDAFYPTPSGISFTFRM